MTVSSPERRAGARKQTRSGSTAGKGRETSGVGREKVSEIQRARILGAMTEVAAERGAANVTVAHVVARSGVSRRTFYELFEDREACFLAAFEDATARIAAQVLPAYEGETRWRDRIRAALAELLEFLDEEPEVGRLCIVESLAAGPRALERRARVVAVVKHALDEGHGESRTRASREPPPLTAEGVIGAVSSVLHARLTEPLRTTGAQSGGPAAVRSAGGFTADSFAALLGPLMGMIVLPYEGMAAATREIERPAAPRPKRPRGHNRDPLRELDMRLTYRTVRVLLAVAQSPGASNRALADAADVSDQGQISKLLSRLKTLGLIENVGRGPVKGEPNAWRLTGKGQQVGEAIQVQTQH
ncbi:MAG TPA: TetR family transcriptional regulator [Solirubrobacteraceae bacterium]|jgi:AcrR family transcriptional regulator